MPPEQDEAAEQPTQDTADAASQEETPAETTDSTNWQERYEHLHPEYTRATQELSQYEQFVEDLANPDTRDAALELLGVEPDDPEYDEDDEYDDEDYDPSEERLDDVEAYLAYQAQQAQAAQAEEAEFDALEEDIESLLEDEGISHEDLTDAELEAVVNLADVMRDEEGRPDVEAAWKTLNGASEAQRSRYMASKRAPRVGTGASPSLEPDLDDDEARRQYIADRLAAEGDAA